MPINEKSLIRQMRVNFKGAGYRVGTLMRGGVEWLMLNGMQWAVALPYSEAGKDLKAQIVSHTGEMPGKPVKVQKDSQQEMLDYLSCHDWADVVDEPEEDDGQEEIL